MTTDVHVFAELLDVPSIRELEGSPHAPYLELLGIFARGTYQDYLGVCVCAQGFGAAALLPCALVSPVSFLRGAARKSDLPELSPPQQKKLRMLTLITCAGTERVSASAAARVAWRAPARSAQLTTAPSLGGHRADSVVQRYDAAARH